MADVVIYTKPGCPYCYSAMALLKKNEMVEKSGGRMTFPQIFIAGNHVGGSDDIHALDREGKLDPLLAA